MDFEKILVECDLYRYLKYTDKSFILEYVIGDEDNKDKVILTLKNEVFSCDLYVDGLLVGSCVIDNNFTLLHRINFLDELLQCQEKTYYIVDNINRNLYQVGIH